MTSPEIPERAAADLPADSVVLDVREPDEWASGHIESAVHIPLGQVTGRLADLPQESPLYVVCRGGGRSSRAVGYLRAQGIDAVNVAGGMQGWAAAGRPMVAIGDRSPEVI